VKLRAHRPVLLLTAEAITSLIGVWAIAQHSENDGLRIAAASSVVVGLCALVASAVLYGLRRSDAAA
jgi:hypothetical protein